MMFNRGYFGDFNCFGYGTYGQIWGVIITIGVVLLAIALILHFTRRNSRRHINDAVLETLKMKLVNGEITEEEYTQKKSIIEKK